MEESLPAVFFMDRFEWFFCREGEVEINLFELESRLKCIVPLHRKACKQILFKCCLRGLSLFLEGKLDRLDPHVGDTACQIRACQLIFLSQEMVEKNKRTYYQEFFQKLKQEIQLLESGQLSELGVLPEEIFFFGVSYFLTVFKLSDGDGGFKSINYKKISICLSISKGWTLRIVRVAQQELCRMSCDFIFNLSFLIDYPHDSLLRIFLKKTDDHRQVLPCFFSSDVIWHYLKIRKIPICFEIRDKSKKNQRIQLFLNEKKSNTRECFLIIADSIFMSQIECYVRNHCDEIFYANVAKHKQYPGIQLREFSTNPFDSLTVGERSKYESVEAVFLKSSLDLKVISTCPIFHMKAKRLLPQKTLEGCFEFEAKQEM